jgi:hypothetical protein
MVLDDLIEALGELRGEFLTLARFSAQLDCHLERIEHELAVGALADVFLDLGTKLWIKLAVEIVIKLLQVISALFHCHPLS